jgi:hypothetical protein
LTLDHIGTNQIELLLVVSGADVHELEGIVTLFSKPLNHSPSCEHKGRYTKSVATVETVEMTVKLGWLNTRTEGDLPESKSDHANGCAPPALCLPAYQCFSSP